MSQSATVDCKTLKTISPIGKLTSLSPALMQQLANKFDTVEVIGKLQTLNPYLSTGWENLFWKNIDCLIIKGMMIEVQSQQRQLSLVGQFSASLVAYILSVSSNIAYISLLNGVDGVNSSNAQRNKVLTILSKNEQLTLKRLVVESDWCNRATSLQLMKKLVYEQRNSLKEFDVDGDAGMTNDADEGLSLLFNSAVVDPLVAHLVSGLRASKVSINFISDRCQSPIVILDLLHKLGATDVTLENCSHVITGSEMRAFAKKKQLAVQTLQLTENDWLYPFSRNAPIGRLRSIDDLMGLMPNLAAINIVELERAEDVIESEKLPIDPRLFHLMAETAAVAFHQQQSSRQLTQNIAQTASIALSRYRSSPFAFKLTYQFPCTVSDMQVMVVAKESVKAQCQAEADFVAEGMTFTNGQCLVTLEFSNDQ